MLTLLKHRETVLWMLLVLRTLLEAASLYLDHR